jgi:hypothetical protein
MATVFRAFDSQRGEEVAVKILSDPRLPATSLKREFRRAVGLAHPNVVFPLDLIEADGITCFTMRLIDGLNLVAALRASTPPDLDGLRAAMADLVAGVEALHSLGLVHGDLKPANVLCTRDGRVILVDLGHARSLREVANPSAGNLIYAAPEVCLGESPRPASDWYGVGAMLYEVLTGSLPFGTDTVSAMVLEKQRAVSPPASLPAALRHLLEDLLDPDPAERGAGAAVRRAFDLAPATPRDGFDPSREGPFIDREHEVAQVLAGVERAREKGRPVVIHLRGPSGIGKSRFLDRVGRVLRDRPGHAVISGTCHRRDHLPLRVLDECVDKLAETLGPERASWQRSLSEDERAACSRIFPILIDEAVDAASTVMRHDPPDPFEREREAAASRERRRLGFRALASAVRSLGRVGMVVMVLDDLQWGDELSARALREVLVESGSSPLAVILSYRAEDQPAEHTFLKDFLGWEDASHAHEVLDLPLGPLSASDARELGQAMALSPTLAEQVALHSRGSPYLIELWARTHTDAPTDPISTDALIQRQLRAASPLDQLILALCALSNAPLARPELASIAAARPIDLELAVTRLENQRLVRTGPAHDTLAPYHDAVRRAVLAATPAAETRALHHRLAESALAAEPPRIASAAIHFFEAGDFAAALAHAMTASREAANRLAFEDAIRLFRLALSAEEHAATGVRAQLYDGLAEASAAAGRMHEAAEALTAVLAETASDEAADALRVRISSLLLQAGRVEEGLAVTSELRRRLGVTIPRSDLGTKVALVRAYLGVTRIAPKPLPELVRSEALPDRLAFELGRGLISFDGNRGSVLILRATRAALRAGDRPLAAYGLCYLGALLAYDGRQAAVTKGRGFIARGRELLVAAPDLRTAIFSDLAESMAAFCGGAFSDSRRGFDAVIARVASSHPVAAWERMVAETTGLYALQHLGDLALLRERIAQLRLRAEDSGDHALAVETELFSSLVLLADDRPGDVASVLGSAISGWRVQGFSSQHWHALRFATLAHLYAGPEHAHLDALLAGVASARGAGLMAIQIARVEALTLEARLRLALLDQARIPRRELARVHRIVKRLHREDCLYASARAALLEAALASRQDGPIRVVELLQRAHALAVRAELGLERAACEDLLASFAHRIPRGDDPLATVIDRARWVAAVAPGFTPHPVRASI